MSKPMRYFGYTVLFLVSFKIFLILTFPFNVLKESLLIKFNNATGLNASVADLSLSFPVGVEMEGVKLQTTTGEQLQFAEIDLSLNPFYLLIGQMKGGLQIYDKENNQLQFVTGFSVLDLITNLRAGKMVMPAYVRLTAENFSLDDVCSYSLMSYANNPVANQLVAPLLQQVTVKGSLNTDIVLHMNSDDPSSSNGELKLQIANFSFAINSDDLALAEQKFKTAAVTANLNEGNLRIQKGSEFTSQDVSVSINGNIGLKTPIMASTLALSIPVQVKGALLDQFGFLISSLLGGTGDGKIPLQVRGTFARPHVSYN